MPFSSDAAKPPSAQASPKGSPNQPARKQYSKKQEIKNLVAVSEHRTAYAFRLLSLFVVCICFFVLKYRSDFSLRSITPKTLWDSLTKAETINLLDFDPFTPNATWLLTTQTLSTYFIFITLTLLIFWVSFISTPSFKALRLLWTTISIALLIKKIADLYEAERLLYFVDFCYYANFVFGYYLWNVPFHPQSKKFDEGFPEVAQALFITLNGPVAGGCFMLSTSLVFHNADAWSSFWLHVTPAFLTYALRWRWFPKMLHFVYDRDEGEENNFKKHRLIWDSVKKIYIPWVVAHCLFLLALPYIPVLREYETLFDWVTSGAKPEVRDEPFPTWARKVIVYCLSHLALALSGMTAAAFAFRYQLVHFVWLAAISTSCMFSGFLFYERSSLNKKGMTEDSDLLQMLDHFLGGGGDAFLAGVKRCGFAWFCVILAYGFCVVFPERKEMKKSLIKAKKGVGKSREEELEALRGQLEEAEERKRKRGESKKDN